MNFRLKEFAVRHRIVFKRLCVLPHARTKFVSYILLATRFYFIFFTVTSSLELDVLLLDDGRYILLSMGMRRMMNLELGMPFISHSFLPMERLISS